jgi:hypothetical protein
MSDNEEQSNKFDFLDVLGTTGLNRQAGQIDEEWLRQLQGDKGHKIYTEMRDNDPVVGALLYAIKTLIRQTKSQIHKASDDPTAIEYANFLESCIEDMSVSWPDFLAEVLSFLPFGWSYFELLYKMRRGHNEDPKLSSNFSDGRVGWRKFAVRSQDTLFKWEFDEEGALLGLWQMAPPNYEQVYIPLEKALHFRTETHKNNPEGRSILRNAYRSWYFLKRIQEIEAIGIERDLAGLPVMQVPVELLASNATSSQKAVVDDFRDMIQKIRRDEYEGVVIPSDTDIDGNPTGFKLSLLNAGGRRPMDVDQIVKRYESRIALSVLGEFVLLGMDGVGSFALSSNKTALFAQALGTYLQGIATTFNTQAIPRLMRLNGWNDAEHYPKLVFSDIETPDVQEIAGALAGLVSAGVITPDDELEGWVRDFANLPKAQTGTARDDGLDLLRDMDAELNEPEEDVVETVPEEESDEETEGIDVDQETPVAAVTLNGAQVSSLLEIIQNVAGGLLPRGSGVEIIATAFNLSTDKADDIMGEVGKSFVPEEESKDE